MALEILKEITDWSQCRTVVPSHTYLVYGDKLIAYAIDGGKKIKVFNKALTMSKSRRKFKTVFHAQLKKVPFVWVPSKSIAASVG